jgi:amino acid transporter
VLLLFINFFSVRTVVARFQMVAMVAKLVAAAIIIITGLYVLIDNSYSLYLKNIS